MSAFVVSTPVGKHIFSKFTEHDYKLNITYVYNQYEKCFVSQDLCDMLC